MRRDNKNELYTHYYNKKLNREFKSNYLDQWIIQQIVLRHQLGFLLWDGGGGIW